MNQLSGLADRGSRIGKRVWDDREAAVAAGAAWAVA